ncbi:hypothetical protein PIB30_025490 [Stylosanthes scabra]|uniref:Peptidase A1 domain-containing protein n=1 Tax=Stylosanthes scabra TaxID=79078 RepID=A0ABU6XBJ9_9FABA|nr:hypothetical protein [Stylosanthes scabra]
MPHSLSLWSFTFLLFFLTFFFLPIPTLQTTLISPVSKDKSTNLFTLSAYLKTPLQPTKLFLDLAFLFPWTLCDSKYKSSSYRYVDCDLTFCYYLGFGGPQCSNCTEAGLPDPNCIIENRICGAYPENSVTRVLDFDAALIDTLALPGADVSTKNRLVSLSNYTFSCAHPSLLNGLPKGVTGLASLSRYNLSIPNQISSALSVPNTFAVCFPGSSKSTGVAFFGSRGPYHAFSQNSKIDLSKSLIYTPLLVNPDGYGDTVLSYSGNPPSYEYFINLTSIRINGQNVPINASLLDFRSEGFFHGIGGTKFSSNTPYGHLESSIYKAFTKLFVKEAASSRFNLTASSPAKPFSVCYAAKSVKVTRLGPVVPTIDLELGGKKGVVWRIVGANSMVRVKNKKSKLDLWCLGFVDNGVSGVNNKTSIVIGAKQLEENLMQFDVESNKLGFTSLLNSSLKCDHFNVTDFAKN